MPQQIAQVEEMLLASASLGEVGPAPLGDEFGRRHAVAVPWREDRETQGSIVSERLAVEQYTLGRRVDYLNAIPPCPVCQLPETAEKGPSVRFSRLATRRQSGAVASHDTRRGGLFPRGWPDPAAASGIVSPSLLQSIGVNRDNTLVFGERRLRACRDILGQDKIEVKVVDVPSIAACEHAENQVRKDFTKMERVAIGETLEGLERAKAKERQGERTDLNIVDNCPQSEVGQKTRDIIAKKVGLGSGKRYEQGKKVASKGSAELQSAVDSGKIAISTAAELTALPKAAPGETTVFAGPAIGIATCVS